MNEEEKTQVVPTTEMETSTDSSTETKPTETLESSTEEPKLDEKPLPFNEDPKIQEYIQRQVDARLGEEASKIEQNIAQKFAPTEEPKIPSWFGGGDSKNPEVVKAWNDFQNEISTMTETKAKKAVDDYKAEQAQQSERIVQANKHFEDSIVAIETDKNLNPEGKKLTDNQRNELLKFVYENELIDSKGNWNYKKGYEFMILSKGSNKGTDDLEERKRLANLANSDNKAETPPKEYKTRDDFKGGNRPW